MKLYDDILDNVEYLALVKKIENTKFITDCKWDWEHGLGHFERVARYVKEILSQLGADDRTIELGIVGAYLHDIGLSKGDKIDHALESSKLFKNFIDINRFTREELLVLEQAIRDHSNGQEIKSLVGLALLLADKLDVTFHRTVNSSIQDKVNKEIQKIKKVAIEINDTQLVVKYFAEKSFDPVIIKEWKKMVLIPEKVATYLKKDFIFLINDEGVDYSELLNK